MEPSAKAKLLGMVQEILRNSTAVQAEAFDAGGWLDHWMTLRQSALGGRTPGDVVDTPDGLEAVARLLGSIESGSYQ